MGAKWLFQLRSAPEQRTSTLHLFDRLDTLGARKVCKWKTQTSQFKRSSRCPAPQGSPEGTEYLLTNPQGETGEWAQEVFLVQFPTDVPDKCYMVMRGKEGDDKVMEAGSGLISIWNMINPTGGNNMSPLYTQAWIMTVEGCTYEMGDLVMRVGSIVIKNPRDARASASGRSDGFKGAVMEVEYLPCVDRSEALPLIQEFVDVYCESDGPTAQSVTNFRPVSSVAPTRGVAPIAGTAGSGPQSVHWTTRTKEYTNEHWAQQYVSLFSTSVAPDPRYPDPEHAPNVCLSHSKN